ncbi:MAG: GumC domain-containing protein, partial [Planctomycetota bacterium]
MPEQKDKMTFRDKVRVFFRWRYLFWLSAAALAAVLLLAAHTVSLEYSAVAKLESRVGPTLPERGLDGVTGTERLEQIRRTLIQGLSGRTTVERVADDLGLFEGLGANGENEEKVDAAKQQIVRSIQARLDIRWDVQSREVDLVSVRFTDSDPDLAADVPNRLVDIYLQNTMEQTEGQLTQSHGWLQSKVDQYKAQLQVHTNKKIELETNHVGLMEDVQLDIVRREQQAKADLVAIRRLRDIAQVKYDSLVAARDELTDYDEPVQVIRAPNPELERLGAELREYKVELDLAMTLQHMTREHPAIKTLLARIALMEDRIRNTPPEIIVQAVYGTGGGAESYAAQVAAAQSEVEMLTAEYHRVEAQIEGYKKMMADFESVRGEYSAVLENVEDLQAKVDLWEARLRQVDMALEAELDNERTEVVKVEGALKPYLPSFPVLAQVLVVTYLGALGFGALVVFFWSS